MKSFYMLFMAFMFTMTAGRCINNNHRYSTLIKGILIWLAAVCYIISLCHYFMGL